MKKSTIEQKLNDAMQRLHSAQADDWHLTGQINYHDSEASRIRKQRQRARSKADRAKTSIANLHLALSQTN